MNYPSLPTDNLYKFVALSGLALILVSLTYPTGKVIELELGAVEVKSQQEKLNIEKSEIDRLLAVLEKANDPKPQEVTALRELHTQSKLKTIELTKSVEVIQIKLNWAKHYLIAAMLGFAIGVLLAFVGFRFWYLRVQRPNDIDLRKKLDESP
jgi:hypothetical protein